MTDAGDLENVGLRPGSRPTAPCAQQGAHDQIVDGGPASTTLPQPKFCTRCGRPWQPYWAECPCCTTLVATPAEPNPCPIRLDGASSLYRRPLTLYFALLAASAIAIIAYRLSPSSEAHVEVIASAAIAAVTAIWAVFSFSQVRPVLANPGRFWHYPLAIGLGIATWGLSSLAVFALTSLLDIETLVLSDSLLQAGYGWAMVMLIYCVQPAIAEELAFRGFILEDLSTLLGLRSAVVVSSLLFMVLHLAPVNFPHLLVVGLVLGILRVRTASLYPCVVMHFTHNLLVIIGEMGGW